jgi:hypothetical protein
MEKAPEPCAPLSIVGTDNEQQSKLLKLLEEANPKSEEWQETAGKLVSQLHLKTLQPDSSDKEFLECISLMAKAQAAGSTIARKKSINVGRFKDRAPIDFSSIQKADDQKSVLNLLSKVRSTWCLEFISLTLQAPSTNKSVFPTLIKWAAKCSGNPSEFWTATLTPLLKSQTDEKNKVAAIKDYEKYAVDFIKQKDPDKSLLEIKDLLTILSQVLKLVTKEKKISIAIISAICIYITRLRKEIPTSIINDVFVAAIYDFSIELTTEDQKREWSSLRDSLSRSAASLLNSITQSLGQSSAEFWRDHLSNLSRAYPQLVDYLKDYGTTNQLIDLLLGNKVDLIKTTNHQYESEESLSNLLLTWQNYRNLQNNISDTDSLDLLIKKVAEFIGVEYFGEIGRSYTYNPIEHNSIDQSILTTNVTILQPGIRLTRRDGTKKILHPAIVK